MGHIHICLVSEQTIPNILAIHSLRPDHLFLVSTEAMERKKASSAILTCLLRNGMDYSTRHRVELVSQDSFHSCTSTFRAIASATEGKKLSVNLTCGTKIMSMAAYNVFRDASAQVIYTPFPRNEFITLGEDPGSEQVSPLSLRLDVRSYITAYGVRISNEQETDVLGEGAARNAALSNWIAGNYRQVERLLGEFFYRLMEARDSSSFTLQMDYACQLPEEYQLLHKLGMGGRTINRTLSKYGIRFLTGDWLSDYCYNEVRKLQVDDCVTGIELINPDGANNEFDVMFTKDNALYIVECKSLKQKTDKGANILYKISALQHDFGLSVKGFLVSTARSILDRKAIKRTILQRARQCHTEVMHPDQITDFGRWVKSQVRGL